MTYVPIIFAVSRFAKMNCKAFYYLQVYAMIIVIRKLYHVASLLTKKEDVAS